jgi:V-type H+-transporting ATPase subunit G
VRALKLNYSERFYIYRLSYTDRVRRLKDARTEADGEIEAYRNAKEQEFSAFQSSVSFCSDRLRRTHLLGVPFQHAGSTQDAQSVIDKDTEEKLDQITDAYNTHKDDVLGKLLDRVVLVQPELHRNLRK